MAGGGTGTLRLNNTTKVPTRLRWVVWFVRALFRACVGTIRPNGKKKTSPRPLGSRG